MGSRMESLRHFPQSTDITDSLTRIVRATAAMKEIDYENDYRPFFSKRGDVPEFEVNISFLFIAVPTRLEVGLGLWAPPSC